MSNLLRSLDIPTSPGQSELRRVNYLDGWRGLAIIMVLEGHFLNAFPVETGLFGVDIFFSLSGFLMSRILFEQRVPLMTFYKRRISRIFPAFSVFVISISLWAYFAAIPSTLSEFAATITFTRTYLPLQPGIWETAVPVGHLWSLNIEEHCYILMSILVFMPFLLGHEGKVLILSGIGCILVGVLYIKLGTHGPHWGALGTEVAASHLLISAGYTLLRQSVVRHISAWMPIVAMIAAVFCYSKIFPWWSHLIVSPFLLAFSVNHLSEAPHWVHSFLSSKLLRFFGLWSFSIYLWQQPFYTYKHQIIGGSPTAFILALTLSLMSFYFLEKPTRTWLNNHW